MRVVHVITRLIVGGAQENTITSVLGLRGKPALEVLLFSGPTYGPEGSLESNVARLGLLTVIPQLIRPIHPLKDLLALQRLTAEFRRLKPDIVHTHSGKAGLLGRLAAARAGVPKIVHTVHGPSFGPFQGALSNALFRAAERFAGRLTTHFVVVADAMRQQYLAAGIGKPENYTEILSGFDLKPFVEAKNDLNLRARLGLSSQDIIVGKIARLFKLKGHEDLFLVAPEIVAKCPRVKFLLVGDGPWRRRFENLARSLGLEKHFVFTGLLPPERVPDFLGIMDMLVHLSLREGLPRALPQALAAGRPVIAYNCDGAREVCINNETGFLLQPGDLAGLKERLLELAGDSALRARLGDRGRQLVVERFPADRMVNALYQLYLRL